MADLGGPYTTGQEIDQYKGDAALGYSGANGVAYNGNPNDANPLSGLDNTLAKMQAEDANMRMQQHLETKERLDNIHKMLRGVGGSAFNMKGQNGQDLSFTPLPEDKKILDQKADEVRKYILAHPNNYDSDANYLKMQQDLDQHTSIAGQRAIFHAQENQAAAQDVDLEDRSGRLKNIQSQLKTPVSSLQAPTPFMPQAKFTGGINPKDYLESSKRQQLGVTVEPVKQPGGGTIDMEVTKTMIPQNVILAPLTDNTVQGINNANVALRNFQKLPESKDPIYIQRINTIIDKNAQAGGYKHYHPADIDADGNVVYNNNPREVLAALNTEAYGGVFREEKPTKIKAEISKIYADIADAKAKLKIAQSEENREASDAAEKDLVAASAVAKVYRLTNDVRDKNTFTTVDKLINNPISTGVKNFFNEKGINANDYTITTLSTKDATVQNIAGEQAQNAVGAETKGINRPVGAYYIKSKTGNVNDDRYVMAIEKFVPVTDGQGNEVIGKNNKPQLKKETQFKLVSPKEAVGHTIKGEKNYDNISDKTLSAVGSGEAKWDEISGGQNKATEPNTQPTKVVERKTLSNGKKYYKDANGDWLEE